MEENVVVNEAEALPVAEAEETTPAVSDAEAAEATAEPTTQAEGETEEGRGAAAPDEGGLFTVKYNKQLRSLSREDAINYAQKGMKYDSVQPMLDTLKYVAASEGKTLAELVEAIRKQNEETTFSRLMDRCGDEEIAKELLAVEKSRHKEAYESLLQREKDEENETDEAVTKRMADDFDVLRKEFPEYTSFEKVPQTIVKEAVEKGITLLDAQLRYEHRQRVKAENARAAQAAAAKTSTGTQQTTGAEVASPVEAALMKGLWG